MGYNRNYESNLKKMKIGDLVARTRYDMTPLTAPDTEYGIVLTEPNEVGNMRVMFRCSYDWVHVTEIHVISKRIEE